MQMWLTGLNALTTKIISPSAGSQSCIQRSSMGITAHTCGRWWHLWHLHCMALHYIALHGICSTTLESGTSTATVHFCRTFSGNMWYAGIADPVKAILSTVSSIPVTPCLQGNITEVSGEAILLKMWQYHLASGSEELTFLTTPLS